ncbi:MAG: glycosyltransferase family 4 protein [Lachnospirales bacterium]
MRKVLIIANQFPPMGGSGVQRSVKFVKHLRSFGYEPVVFTREEGNMPLKDETLLKDIPTGVKIYKTKPYELPEMTGIMRIPGKVLGKFIIPDTARFWMEKSKKKVLEVIKKENIDLIYTTSAPYSDHLLGLYIKKKMPNIKWVVDFRDEWTNNPYTLDNPYNPIRTKIEKKMENRVLNTADMLITNTPVMRENFVKNHNLKGDNFFVIPNGYDIEDFKDMDCENKPNNTKLTMVYTGALYGRRKPDTFFEALKELKEEGKIDGNKILVKLIGNYHKDKLQAQIDSFGLTEQFEIVGYVPHNVCIKHQIDADVLVLIEGSGRGANAFYTGKIFEYMNTNRPVLAILPEGAASDLVKESRIGIVANTDRIDEIKANIKLYYDKWVSGELDFEPDRNVIEGFERKVLTQKLAEIFDKL